MKLDEQAVARYKEVYSKLSTEELKQIYLKTFPFAIKCKAVSQLLHERKEEGR